MSIIKELLQLNEVASAEVFTVAGKEFKARANPNNAPSTWDLVLVNAKDDISITVPEFFSYSKSSNDDGFEIQAKDYSSQEVRPAQSKPFPGGTFERKAINNFCSKLSDNDPQAVKLAKIEDPDNKLAD